MATVPPILAPPQVAPIDQAQLRRARALCFLGASVLFARQSLHRSDELLPQRNKAVALTAVSAFLLYRQTTLDTSEQEVPLPTSWPKGTYIPDTKADLKDPHLGKAKDAIRKSIATLRVTRSGDILVTWLSGITLVIFVFGMLVALGSSREKALVERLLRVGPALVSDWSSGVAVCAAAVPDDAASATRMRAAMRIARLIARALGGAG